MAGVELMRDPEKRIPYSVSEQVGARVTQAARRHGVIIRTLGDVIVFMPPLSVSGKELDALLEAVKDSVREVTEP